MKHTVMTALIGATITIGLIGCSKYENVRGDAIEKLKNSIGLNQDDVYKVEIGQCYDRPTDMDSITTLPKADRKFNRMS